MWPSVVLARRGAMKRGHQNYELERFGNKNVSYSGGREKFQLER